MTKDSELNSSAQRIKATPYSAPSNSDEVESGASNSLPADPQAQIVNRPWWYSQFNLMLVVFALLGFAAVLFIALLPSPTANLVESPLTENSSSSVSVQSGNGSDEVSPWNEARRAQARTDAQEILSNLLDSKKYLEEKEVQNWAASEFAQALELAEQGDELYKQQDYQQALDVYQSAVDKLDNLYEQLPIYVQSKIDEGQQAIDGGKSQLANDAFSAALAIEPNNFAAMNGLSRAKILDQVLQLSQAAKDEQQLFLDQDDLEILLSAKQKLDEALSLDKENTDVKAQLEEITVLQQDKQYRDAMTQGFAALFANRYTSANSAFASALKINPDDKTASLAYQQSLASNKTSSLQGLLNRAKEFEQNENWQNALGNYKAVLSRDSNQVQAKLGEIRSAARAQLDADLRKTLSDPLALTKKTQKQQAQELLSDARAIRSAGPKLSTQIQQLESALKATDATIKVQITSDAVTEISLTKEGSNQLQLGRFNNKNLALKPGRYVLTGVRLGYRDVRKEIELYSSNSGLQTFDLKCDQPISANLQEKANGPA